jgi:hypothetical protein
MDTARRWTIAHVVRTPIMRPLATNRDARMLARTTLGVLFAFAATLFAPGALFVLGPVVFGVAHVAGDLRYLVRRPGLPAPVTALMYGGCATLLALRALEMSIPDLLPYARVELVLAGTWIVAAAAAARRSASAFVIGLAASLVALAWNHAPAARIVFAHVHNVVGIVIWLVVFRRRRAPFALPLALMGFATLALVAGWTLPLVARFGGFDFLGATLPFVSDWLAPSVGYPLAQGLTLSYVFLQSLHYMVWLVWIPDEDTRAQGTPTFRMTARGLTRDFTAVGLAAIALAAIAMVVAALFDVHRTRTLYLSLATFHGYLELAALAYLSRRVA